MHTERTCLECGEVIRGRADKKFCDDQCRSTYNREHRLGDDKNVKRINAILKRNRQILVKMNPCGKTMVLCKEMLMKGFDFGYFTSILRTQKNTYYYFCYDMGYSLIDRDHVLLVKKEDRQRMEMSE